MSLFKAIFGGNDDKKSVNPNSATLPESNTEKEYSKEMIPLEELYRLEEMQILAQPTATANPNEKTQPNSPIPPKGAFGNTFVPKPIVVDTKLTIILVENTNKVAKEKDKLKAIVKKLVTTGYICVINYGTLVRESEMVEAKNFDCDKLIHKEFVGDTACLFDAINTLEEVVKKNYQKTEEVKNKRVRIKSIDVIGIGRCLDNCSITSSEIASESFYRVARYTDVNTKYFCLTEESFIAAATMGFHSIGAIDKNYM